MSEIIWTKCGLSAAAEDLRGEDAMLGRLRIALLVDHEITGITDCDEDHITEPSWDGYARADPNPWGSVTLVEEDEQAQVTSALLEFAVDSDPGSEEIVGWAAIVADAPTGERLWAYEIFDSPVTPEEGTPYLLVVRVRVRNCP